MHNPSILPWQAYPSFSDEQRILKAEAYRDAMVTRRSCRHFDPRPVPRGVIEAAIDAANSAPSGANRQPWHFTVIESPEAKCAIRVAVEEEERVFYGKRAACEWLDTLAPLGTTAEKPYLETAAWLVVAFGRRRGEGEEGDLRTNYHVVESVGIACGMLLSALHLAGIATLVHTPSPARFLNRVCRRPEHEKPLMIVAAGHAAADASIPASTANRRPADQVTSWL